jgi:hypothetical protein
MFSLIYNVILNSLTRQVVKRPLGRWHSSSDLNVNNFSRDWSSADNCGVCRNHDDQTPPIKKREIYYKSGGSKKQ